MALSWQLPCGQRVVSRLRLASFRSWKQASLCPFCPLEHFRLQPAVREGTVFTPRTAACALFRSHSCHALPSRSDLLLEAEAGSSRTSDQLHQPEASTSGRPAVGAGTGAVFSAATAQVASQLPAGRQSTPRSLWRSYARPRLRTVQLQAQPPLQTSLEVLSSEQNITPALQAQSVLHQPSSDNLADTATTQAQFQLDCDQMPDADCRHHERGSIFDWAGQTDYSSERVLEPSFWGPDNMTGTLDPIMTFWQGQELEARPVWVAIYQLQDRGPARVYISTHPLDEATLSHMTMSINALYWLTVDGMLFNKPTLRMGPWRNYCTAFIGSVAHREEDVQWPNQVLHEYRVMYNLRDGNDLARFLAAPERDNLLAHSVNLRRMAEERGYKHPSKWAYHRMCERWGRDAVDALKEDVRLPQLS